MKISSLTGQSEDACHLPLQMWSRNPDSSGTRDRLCKFPCTLLTSWRGRRGGLQEERRQGIVAVRLMAWQKHGEMVGVVQPTKAGHTWDLNLS